MSEQTEDAFNDLDDDQNFDEFDDDLNDDEAGDDVGDDFVDDSSEDLDDESDDDIEWVSKSQLKRDSKALQDLGKRLSSMNADQLNRIPLDDQLREAIALAQRISNKRGALKRHFQFIGKLLRNIDAEPIIQAVHEIDNAHTKEVAKFRQLELWRDRILAEGDEAIQAYCAESPDADRQQLRQIVRNYQKAKDDNARTKFARQLFKLLRQ